MPSTLGVGTVGEGSIGIQGPMIRRSSGHIGPIVGDVSRTVELERSSNGFIRAIHGSSDRQTALNRSSSGYLVPIVGDATARSVVYRSAEGHIGPVVGEIDRTVSLERSSSGHVGPITGEASSGARLVRSASGHIGPIVGETDRLLVLVRSGEQQTNTIGEGTVGDGSIGEISEHGPGYIGPIVGESDRTVDLSRSAGGHVGPVQGDATRALRLIRRIAKNTIGDGSIGDGVIGRVEGREPGYLSPIVGEADRTVDLNRSADGYLSPIVGSVDWGWMSWEINGLLATELTSEVRDWQRLTLTFRSELETIRDVLRPLDSHAGSLSVTETSDGSFRAKDRAGGANTVEAVAPFQRRDVRPIETWLVEEYEEEVIDQDGERYEAVLELTATGSKPLQEQYDDVDESDVGDDEWLFDLDTGSFASRRVRHNIGKAGADGVETTMLTLDLEPLQVRILEENASKQAAVTIREVMDGSNFVTDAADENTLELTVPDDVGDGISSGTFAIMEWETEWLNDAYYSVSLEIAAIQ